MVHSVVNYVFWRGSGLNHRRSWQLQLCINTYLEPAATQTISDATLHPSLFTLHFEVDRGEN